VWSPDGSQVIFASNRSGVDLHQKASNNAGSERLFLHTEQNKWPNSISRDGRYLLYEELSGPRGDPDLWLRPLTGERKPVRWLKTEFSGVERGVFARRPMGGVPVQRVRAGGGGQPEGEGWQQMLKK
jgi:hypothetical protein